MRRESLKSSPEGITAFARECTAESPELGEYLFEPYDYQIEFWTAILEEIAKLDANKRPLTIHDEKSRQMGMSWASAIFILWSLHAWQFVWRALVLSYRENLIDDGGQKSTTDSLFGKVRFMYDHLPPEIKPNLEFRMGRIVNVDTGATIIASSTNPTSKQSGGGGRGGSYRWAAWDEAAFGAHSWQVWAGLSRAARVKILWSTPNGKANVFAWMKFRSKGGVRFLRQHWSQHPVFGADCTVVNGKMTSPWYEEECLNMTDEDIARELDISYEASVKGRAFPEFSVEAHVKPGIQYGGGRLFAGIDFGVGVTAINIHEYRSLPDGTAEIVTVAAMELEAATADVIVGQLKGWKERDNRMRIFGDPAGSARAQTTGTSIVSEMGRLGMQVENPQRLKDVARRVRTCRLLLGGKEIRGRTAIYVCGEASPGLKWFAECLEQAKWPTDREGVVLDNPTDLEDNEYTHHADAFGYAVEGYFGVEEIRQSGLLKTLHRPLTAGLRKMTF